MEINGYRINGELSNDNSGFSKWGFGQKNGNSYFIKEFLTPVYPTDSSAMSPELFERKRAACEAYEENRLTLYRAVNECSRGNVVRVNEFFRADNHYYIVTERIVDNGITIENIAALPMEDKLTICRSIAYCFACLHGAHIVHFDVKPSNILMRLTSTGKYAAKVIDFDESNFVSYFANGDIDINADLVYLAPETFLRISGANARISEKTDIFSLALVFHEYLTGTYPILAEGYDYAYENVLDEGEVRFDASLPPHIRGLLGEMLSLDPDKRPDAGSVMHRLTMTPPVIEVTEKEPPVMEKEPPEPGGSSSKVSKYFDRAGDL